MNRDVHPCDDFYEFVCGGYSKRKPVPENEIRFTIQKEMTDDLDWKLKSLLEQVAVNDTDAMKMAQIYYSSCMNVELQETMDLLPITQMISNLGGWPLLQNAKFDDTNFKWESLAGQLLVHGVPTILDLYVHNSPANNSRNILTVSYCDVELKTHQLNVIRIIFQINFDLFLNRDLLLYLSPLPGNTILNIVDKTYFSQLTQLLGKTRMSDYMFWKFVQFFNIYLPPRYRVPIEKFYLKINKRNAKTNWQRCVDLTRINLGFPLASGYVAKYFSWEKKHEVKHIASEMVLDLKSSMENTLLNTDWMDESTRSAALLKLNNTKERVAFPDFITNQNILLRPYAEWLTSVISADTYHYYSGNEIIFPAGILQYPLFIIGAPGFINYGAIGMNIGYELTHGFDDIGAKYDENGLKKKWWHSETERIFNSKKQCFIAQYGSKFEPITGRKAYQMHSTRRPELYQLPGLANYTNEQLFFIVFANNWCEAIKSNEIDHIIDTSTQSLGMFRVNVPLQNFPAFSQAFQCPIGSGMNPFEKCRIW
uniref:Neprilysin n=1 Tax=Syphacia muris TaxID=451379 RepID=A0A158R4U0_9BILA